MSSFYAKNMNPKSKDRNHRFIIKTWIGSFQLRSGSSSGTGDGTCAFNWLLGVTMCINRFFCRARALQWDKFYRRATAALFRSEI